MAFAKGESGNKKTQFTATNQPKENGRPRKFLSTLTAEGYTKAEVTATYAALLSRTFEELKAIYENKAATVLERTVANAVKKDFEKGSLGNIESILTRSHGAPKQEAEISGKDGNPIVFFRLPEKQ
jgi:hypothetical protein